MHHRNQYLLSLLLAGLCGLPYGLAYSCVLAPFDTQLQITELRADTPQYAEVNYRKELLRFVNAYYSDIAGDLLRGNGDYLTSLHRLMGSDDDSCTSSYREILLTETGSQNFALALWTYRVTDNPQPGLNQQQENHP